MILKIQYPKGATPLDPDELAGLIPNYITTQGELNTLERDNILDALTWAAKKKKTKDRASISFAYDLHQQMFGRVWKWAGTLRKTDKNIGVAWAQVSSQLPSLFQDLDYWIINQTYSWDEIGARFHHRLVAIHAFPNGNGRHARLLTDLIFETHGQIPFTWGMSSANSSLEADGVLRDEYIEALRETDSKKMTRLIQFVKS
jgi:Fic-DOC domain mobile mystery protein B